MAVLEGKRPSIGDSNHISAKKARLEPKEEEKVEAKDEKDDVNNTWSALRENFMLDTKMKDWDKEVEI